LITIANSVSALETRDELSNCGLGIYDDFWEHTADVEPGANNTVTFAGFIDGSYFFNESVEKASFHLFAETNYGWPVAITPPVFDMESPEIINFTALVLVPYETSADVEAKITFNSTATIHPFNITWSCTLDSRIKVKQFYSLEVKVEEHKKTVTKSDNVVYRLTITNRGNGDDSVVIRRPNNEELARDGVGVYLSTYSPIINEKETRDLIVTLDIARADAGRDYDIDLVIESESSVKVQENVTLTVTIEREPGFYFAVTGAAVFIILIIVLILTRRKKGKAED
jgi:hypothetical protein